MQNKERWPDVYFSIVGGDIILRAAGQMRNLGPCGNHITLRNNACSSVAKEADEMQAISISQEVVRRNQEGMLLALGVAECAD